MNTYEYATIGGKRYARVTKRDGSKAYQVRGSDMKFRTVSGAHAIARIECAIAREKGAVVPVGQSEYADKFAHFRSQAIIYPTDYTRKLKEYAANIIAGTYNPVY